MLPFVVTLSASKYLAIIKISSAIIGHIRMHALDFDLRWRHICFAGGRSSNGDRSSIITVTRRIVGQVVEQCHPDHITVLVNRVCGRVWICIVGQ